ncbi:MAG: outer membrane lipoprotein carrier protein LolA [Desulfobacterales bacterium]|nr:outer membrane lipoprotein carrier protein LolA [Desulfobacterales bacterium]
MKYCMTTILGLLFTFTAAFWSQALATETKSIADTKESILTGLEEKYANKGFSARFEQASKLTALDITETATGKAWFSHPGKMRWQYEAPDTHEIVTNGETLWIYRPQENQVMHGSAAPFFQAGNGGAFLSDIRRIRNDFKIDLGKTGDNFAELVLMPKAEQPDLAKVLITVDLPSHEIHLVVTENTYGDTTRFYFTNIHFNTPDARMFDFTIPEDVEIIEMN